MSTATTETTTGRVAPKDLRAPLAAASTARAKEIVIGSDCSISFRTNHVQARLPFAGRGWDGDEARVGRAAFARIVRACRQDMLLEPVEQGLRISSGPLTVTLPLARYNEERAPQLPGDEHALKTLVTLEARELARGILRAETFASLDGTRPVLNAVVAHALADQAGDATLELADLGNHREVVVKVGDQHWAITVAGGTFPKWRDLLPDDEGPISVDVDAGELAAVASLIEDAYAIGKQRNAPMVLKFSKGAIDISTRYPECIEVSQRIEAEGRVAEDMETGTNPKFVRQVAQAVAPDTARVTARSPLRPLLVTSPDALFLVMPIRLNV